MYIIQPKIVMELECIIKLFLSTTLACNANCNNRALYIIPPPVVSAREMHMVFLFSVLSVLSNASLKEAWRRSKVFLFIHSMRVYEELLTSYIHAWWGASLLSRTLDYFFLRPNLLWMINVITPHHSTIDVD